MQELFINTFYARKNVLSTEKNYLISGSCSIGVDIAFIPTQNGLKQLFCDIKSHNTLQLTMRNAACSYMQYRALTRTTIVRQYNVFSMLQSQYLN